jgi:hypothetical protein
MSETKQYWIMHLVLNTLLYIFSYFSYSALLVVVSYTITLLLFSVVGTPLEHSLVAFLSGPFRAISFSLDGRNLVVIADGKNISSTVSFIIVLLPLAVGAVFELVGKIFRIKIGTWHFSLILITIWFIETVILSIRLKNLFIPFILLLASVFFLVAFICLMIVTERIKRFIHKMPL